MCSLHEQFASVVDQQELFALTARERKYKISNEFGDCRAI
jgi:hypothetical protein